jgi:hypothetical protein
MALLFLFRSLLSFGNRYHEFEFWYHRFELLKCFFFVPIMIQDPGHDLQSTCGRIQMLATEIFRQGLPPPGANTELVPSMAPPARGAKFF